MAAVPDIFRRRAMYMTQGVPKLVWISRDTMHRQDRGERHQSVLHRAVLHARLLPLIGHRDNTHPFSAI